MKYILAFILCINVALADGYGVVQLGQGKAALAYGTSSGDVAWQQKGFPHSEDLTTRVYSVGVGYQFLPWLSSEIRYHDLGIVSQKGNWLYNDDGTVSGSCPCYGEGNTYVKGWSIASIVKYPFNNFSIGIEAGAFEWQAPWKETILLANGNVTYHDPVKSSGIGMLTGIIFSYKSFDIRWELFHVEPRDGIFNKIRTVSVSFVY